jgi:hypothetical protein
MAIEFDCPHCRHHYRLKDELAGKTAACKTCRQKIVIPNPVTVPDDAEAAEAAALAALTDEPAKVERDAASRLIPVECPHCAHKWTEPIARAGKNTLCPNPECKQRIKIPEPKDEGQYDWRQTRTKGPTLAKQNQEKLDGVQDAADVRQLSHQTVKETILEDDTEPRPLKEKVMLALLAVGLVAAVAFGVRYTMKSRTEGGEDRLMQDAQEELAKGADGYPKGELPLLTAVQLIAAGEHAVRHNTKDKLKVALDQFAKARETLRPGSTPARNAACGELAVALLELGGTEEQAREELRIRWVPEANAKYRPNERVFTVFDELRTTLGLVQAADPDFRADLARRLTRELVKRDQFATAIELIPKALFSQTEAPEAKAVVALELYRKERSAAAVRAVAEELKSVPPDGLKNAPSAQILFAVLKTEKAPSLFSPPPAGGGPVVDSVRYAYTGIFVLEGKLDEALKLALRVSSSPTAQLRALALDADLATDPGPALDAAYALISANKDAKYGYLGLRFAQLAAAAGKLELAKQFAATVTDDGLRAWAQGEVARVRLAALPTAKGDEGLMDLPEDARNYRAGHAWGRVWIARRNARLSGDRAAEVKAVNAWPSPLVPFGKAGVALGLQDK